MVASATPQLTNTAAPTLSPTPTVPASYEDRLLAAKPDIERAMRLMKAQDYAAAMPLWDSILARVPEYGDGYLQRLICRRNNQVAGSLGEYLALLLAIIRDADASIALDPTANGDNYFYRSLTYQELGREQVYRVDQDAYLEIALDNLQVANAIGPRTDYSLRLESFVLYSLGRCDAGLARTRELIAQSDMTQVPVFAGLHSALASGFLCKGQLSEALEEMDATLAVEYSARRMFTRAVILYNLGRRTDALSQLEEMYQVEPFGNGYRRYLEALIRLEMGDRAQALDALEIGAANTWNHYGLYSYVIGMDAMATGDRQRGMDSMALAQATMLRDYGPILWRIESELSQLGVPLYAPTPSSLLSSTPIPTLTPTVTPRVPLETTSILQPLILVDAARGTGPHVFRSGDYPEFLFQLPAPIEGVVTDVTAHLIPIESGPLPSPELQFMFLVPGGGWVQAQNPLSWGATEIPDASRFLTNPGDLTVGIHNPSDHDIFVRNIAFTIRSKLPSGEIATYGWPAP
jgi:tetratricopeptide (TPR) repeat protein